MLKAILFDFDGTLAETNTLIFKCMEKTFLELFGKCTKEQILDCIGPPLLVKGKELYPENPEHFVNTYRKYQLKYHDDMITAYPNIIDMLQQLKNKNLKLAIVTSKKKDMFLRGLRKLEMEKYFEVFVAEEDVKNHKPHPEPINLALEKLNILPSEALMVGDNWQDVVSAQKALVKCAVVGWSIKGLDFLKEYNPDFVMIEAFDILNIIEKFPK